ncbi:MAG: DNA polymerase Y family protein, partial [Rhodocyclaceae bacterium]
MLWLALWLPDLPLAAFATRPLASVVAVHGQILAADEVARAAGIVPGMRTATARALLPEIAVLARDPAREAALIEELACWAGRFTPTVSLAPPAALLLEIGASLRLFGGTVRLLDMVNRGCAERRLTVQRAAAPTPLAALWLARDGDATGASCRVVAQDEPITQALAPLPVEVIDAAPESAARLAAFGVRHLGDLFALPRSGLARRLGHAFTETLERALGERPDPRPRFIFPPRFALRLELPQPAGEAPALSFMARRLIEALCGWLAQRQAGIATCTLIFEHERSLRHSAELRLELRCASPT